MNTHLMIDLETLGNTADTVVLSMGAVLFTKEKQLATGHWFFNYGMQIKAKRAIDPSTLHWWLKQGDGLGSLMSQCMAQGKSASAILTEFTGTWLPQFAPGVVKELRAWSKGANFDVPIVEHMMAACGIQVPWQFWNVRCYRTLHTIWGLQEKPNAKKHDALSDAITQATAVREFLEANPGADK